MTESLANSMNQITWVIILWILRHQPTSLERTRVDLTIRVFYNHLCHPASSLIISNMGYITWVICNHMCDCLWGGSTRPDASQPRSSRTCPSNPP